MILIRVPITKLEIRWPYFPHLKIKVQSLSLESASLSAAAFSVAAKDVVTVTVLHLKICVLPAESRQCGPGDSEERYDEQKIFISSPARPEGP